MTRRFGSALFSLSFSLLACGGGNKQAEAPASEEEHRGFMSGCLKEEQLKDYCECSFDYIVKQVPAEERAKSNSPQVKKAVSEAPRVCQATIPQEYHRKQFISECSEEVPAPRYCGCAFDFLKARGLLDKGEEEIAPQAADLAENCGSALLADTKDQFVQGCSKNQTPELCGCIFENLRATFGSKELLVVFEKEQEKLGPAIRNAQASCTK